ncbi:uncharacterized protein LOC141594747 [Silene latifolia]|uniref:uncharacterized protein LOC141594747 n=1 Tax=Silene latifolia TaxID=37657 RepID=UPI003D76E616
MWIFNTFAPALRRQISLRPEAKQVWVDLKNRFCQANEARIYQLQTDLHSCRQGASELLVDYYGRLTTIWDALLDQDPLPRCSCNPCNCDWVTLINNRREKARVRDFLMGLDTRFANTRSQILGITPLPSLDIIYNRLLQDEGVRNLSSAKLDTTPDVMAFAARASNGSRQSDGGGRRNPNEPSKYFCVICQKPGHSVKFCYQVTGNYPESWGDRPRPRVHLEPSIIAALLLADSRGKAQPDRGKSIASPKVNMASGKSSSSTTANTSNSGSQTPLAQFDNIDLNSLTPQALDELGRLLQARQSDSATDRLNGNTSPLSWIIDMGASHHMSGCLSHFSNLKHITPLSVGLPNGDLTIATQSGDICLSPRLILRDVLYSANLHCNLLSVSSLLMNKTLTIQFSHNMCLIQDRISKTVTGAGEQYEGLYHLKGVRCDRVHAHMTDKSNSFDLWHRRLGHPSSNISCFLSFLNKNSRTCDDFHSKHCDICLRAKQTPEHFNLSYSHAISAFELIHCDLWGPYSENASCGSKFFSHHS